MLMSELNLSMILMFPACFQIVMYLIGLAYFEQCKAFFLDPDCYVPMIQFFCINATFNRTAKIILSKLKTKRTATKDLKESLVKNYYYSLLDIPRGEILLKICCCYNEFCHRCKWTAGRTRHEKCSQPTT